MTSYKAFLKKVKIGPELVPLPCFLHDFCRKVFLLLSDSNGIRTHSHLVRICIKLSNFIFWLSLLRQLLGKCIVIVC